MKLFHPSKVKGVFKGFSEGGMEFHADIVLKYENEFQRIPMHGQFLIISLENGDEAVLGRITSISSQGKLASSEGEDYGLRAAMEDREIKDDLREQYLKYKINIRVLGVIRVVDGQKLIFSPSHRRLPHVGSKVAFLSDELLQEIAGHNLKGGAQLGYFALGEFIYGGDDKKLVKQEWMQIKYPCVIPKFKVEQLVSRRTFVFARAGFGKSNLIKLLFSELYKQTPCIKKRGDKMVPVGTIIFDPDGEYFWPDDSERPGLCDVPHLQDKVVVFTNKQGPSEFYNSFIGGGIKLDIRRLKPSEVIAIALSTDKQDQQNVVKLKQLSQESWHRLVDIIYQHGNDADIAEIRSLLRLNENQEFEALAARSNITRIVRLLHDPSSQLKDILFQSLKEGKLCVIDISQMRGQAGLVLSGIILQQIFEHNQQEFTKKDSESIPTLAVLEEAQSVLGGAGGTDSPYVAWVKEGRKYGLGAVLITQQPGSISNEILSQGDNWFIFHLLSAGDLQAVKKANAHFSEDLLSSLLNEPIPGNGIFWSSSGGKSYPISLRVLSFESLYQTIDNKYNMKAVATYAHYLKKGFDVVVSTSQGLLATYPKNEGSNNDSPQVNNVEDDAEGVDVFQTFLNLAFSRVRSDSQFMEKLENGSMHWMGLQMELVKHLPSTITDKEERKQIARSNIIKFMNEVFGKDKWRLEPRPSKSKPGEFTKYFILT